MVSLHQPSKSGTTSPLPYIFLISTENLGVRWMVAVTSTSYQKAVTLCFWLELEQWLRKASVNLREFLISVLNKNKKAQTQNITSKPNHKEPQTTLHKRNLLPSPSINKQNTQTNEINQKKNQHSRKREKKEKGKKNKIISISTLKSTRLGVGSPWNKKIISRAAFLLL